MKPQGRVLVVAGSDSGGGAGIQADIKTVTALGGYAATAITALTVQNTQGVFGVLAAPPALVAEQMRVVLEDIGADCVKTGMLHSNAVVEAVLDALPLRLPLVVDPVMVAKGGALLLEAETVELMRHRLVPRATLITPNVPEAVALTGLAIDHADDQVKAGEALCRMGAAAALIKGGHLSGAIVVDVLVAGDKALRLTGPRLETRHTHGTGCTLA
ncbi:MAG: bifunctional hydroxymethylpyrimidine kinase/phosphomethylpyrimidine kinase, partial [Alphaproteobacteria bacterium]|nr:bifunctional hydroxymethylpyrimidine kinase/phosphomethylpyrimidine kinase [Alphaproteobacteria bacterium]